MTLTEIHNTEDNESLLVPKSNTWTFVFDRTKNQDEAEKLYKLLSTLDGVTSVELITPNYATVNVICKLNDPK